MDQRWEGQWEFCGGEFLFARSIFLYIPLLVNSKSSRAARIDLAIDASYAKRRKEAQCRDRTSRMILMPFALETLGALFAMSDQVLVVCASLASRSCAGANLATSILCTWFRRVSIELQQSLANATCAR